MRFPRRPGPGGGRLPRHSQPLQLEWNMAQATGNGDSIVARASRRMRRSEHLIVKLGAGAAQDGTEPMVLERPGPRVCEESVGCALRLLLSTTAARSGGVHRDDPGRHHQRRLFRLRNQLIRRRPPAAIYVDAPSVLVNPDITQAQIETKRPEPEAPGPEAGVGPGVPPGADISGSGEEPAGATPAAPLLRHRGSQSGPSRSRHGRPWWRVPTSRCGVFTFRLTGGAPPNQSSAAA